jgi:hypothetical protein
MGKISIDTLFPDAKYKKTGLDIETIFPKSIRSDASAPYFNSEELFMERHKKVINLHVLYRQLLSECIDNIRDNNDMDITDMIFPVPLYMHMQPKYDSADCLRYIESKLRKQYLDTLIISKKEIFISWLDVEKNKEIDNAMNKYR